MFKIVWSWRAAGCTTHLAVGSCHTSSCSALSQHICQCRFTATFAKQQSVWSCHTATFSEHICEFGVATQPHSSHCCQRVVGSQVLSQCTVVSLQLPHRHFRSMHLWLRSCHAASHLRLTAVTVWSLHTDTFQTCRLHQARTHAIDLSPARAGPASCTPRHTMAQGCSAPSFACGGASKGLAFLACCAAALTTASRTSHCETGCDLGPHDPGGQVVPLHAGHGPLHGRADSGGALALERPTHVATAGFEGTSFEDDLMRGLSSTSPNARCERCRL